ncbi:GNAT family N-acetyltransferase [Wenyingzhuangia sp. IMCC45574]
MSLINKNIENLVAIWSLVNTHMKTYQETDELAYGVLNNSQWPNRVWFKNTISQENLEEAIKLLKSAEAPLLIPCWDIYNKNAYKLLEAKGLNKRITQVGMSLALSQQEYVVDAIRLEKVDTRTKAELWSELFTKAFKYVIATEVIEANKNHLDFVIAYHKNIPVGTVLLYKSHTNILGIHAMGVVPEQRRKGFAEQLMKSILNDAVAKGIKHAVLQASDAGKGLYIKLGFKEEFLVRTYSL